jgi:KipI family sensor histidine kinase inhibitor
MSLQTSARMRVLPMRAGSLMFELANLSETLALFDALQAAHIAGVKDIIPAARTLLITFDPLDISTEVLVAHVRGHLGKDRQATTGPVVDIPVRYDGEDLAEAAEVLGISTGELIERHTASDYVVAFTGFAPGFAYLAEGDPRLAVPRRKSPRTQVPAGSVGLAGEFSGVYPKTSPGGWQLIGTTPRAMFDLNREPAALLQPGYRVRFRDMASKTYVEVANPIGPVQPVQAPPAETYASITVLSAGLPVLFQDLGRFGKTGLGISASGAADRGSLKRANRIVGNPANAAALEIAPAGFSFRMQGRGVIALTGAPSLATITTPSGTSLPLPINYPVALDDGDIVTLQPPVSGMRTYLAIRGGFAVTPVLDSCCTDTLAQIGPAFVKAGDIVGINTALPGSHVQPDDEPVKDLPKAGQTVTLDVTMGPRTDWFTEAGVQQFLAQDWLVTPKSSRVGIRLEGVALERRNTDELPSEATMHGAIQVPASGQPVLFLSDHPLTGGYPVIANVAEYHLDLAGQVPVGARIRFNPVGQFAEFGSIAGHAL